VILVQDQGIGIPPEEQGALFQEFFRASNARAHAPGTGLGLVLARRLAEANHGVLEVRSPDPEEGRGTLVVLRLPTRKPQESP
jgi:signal transduction histidine kinase